MADRSLEEATGLLGRPDEIAPFEGIPQGAIRPPDGGAARAEEARWHASTLRIIFVGGKAGLITARFPSPLDTGNALRTLGLGVLGAQRPSADLPEQVRWANTPTNPPLSCVRLNREPPTGRGAPVAWFFVTVRAGYTPAAC